MLPFTLHEQRLDRTAAAVLRGLQAELAELRALIVDDRGRMEHLDQRLEDVENGRARQE